MTSDAETRIASLSEHVADRRKISRRRHLEQIVQAYALYALSRDEPTIKDTVVQLTLGKRRVIDARTSELRLCVEAFISYGTDEDEAQRANHAYSRDVAAIKTLIKRGVLPSQVIGLASKAGEGLDAWARANSKARQHDRPTLINTAADVEQPPAGGPGMPRPKRPDPMSRSGMKPIVRLEIPLVPQRFSWILQLRNGDKTMRELEFLGSREAEEL